MGHEEGHIEYPVRRDLDGMYFRVERNGEWRNVCLTDLTDDEYEMIVGNRSDSWYKSALDHLRNVVREVGDATGIVRNG